jgi:hypothetical protein
MENMKPMPEEVDDELDDEPNVTPEDQKQYDAIVLMGMDMIWKKDGSKNIAQMLRGAKAPEVPYRLGAIGSNLMRSIKMSFDKNGSELDPDTFLSAGQEIMANLVEFAMQARLFPPSKKEDVYRLAVIEGTRRFGEFELKEGGITPESQAEAREVFAQMSGQKSGIIGREMRA